MVMVVSLASAGLGLVSLNQLLHVPSCPNIIPLQKSLAVVKNKSSSIFKFKWRFQMSWNDRQLMNRRFMSRMNQEDAFVTGYFFVWWKVPDKVAPVYTKLFAPEKYNLVASNPDDMSAMLSALTIAVPTIPDTMINQNSMSGMGGVKWGVATNIDHPTNVGFKFRELAGLPVCKTIASWFSLIRDPNSGISLLQGEEYTKKNWSGEALLSYVKPDGVTVEMATRFEGIYPLKYPSDLFTSDVTAVNPLEADIDFHVDSIWSDPQALAEAKNIINRFRQAKPYHQPGTPTLYGVAA